jgi:thiol-disulfide isomerase/thioredoxin
MPCTRISKTTALVIFVLTVSTVLLMPSCGVAALDKGTSLKKFEGISIWINSPPLTLASLKNKVVVIDFYTSGCSNCLAAVPHVVALYRKYHSKGLEVVGVHTPEMEFEHRIPLIKDTARRLGIEYPIAVDNDSETWRAYNNSYWPNLLIFDRDGKLVYEHAGDGAYDEIDRKVASLL